MDFYHERQEKMHRILSSRRASWSHSQGRLRKRSQKREPRRILPNSLRLGLRWHRPRHWRMVCSTGRSTVCWYPHPVDPTIYSHWHHDLQRQVVSLQRYSESAWGLHSWDCQSFSKFRPSCYKYTYSKQRKLVDVYENEKKIIRWVSVSLSSTPIWSNSCGAGVLEIVL